MTEESKRHNSEYRNFFYALIIAKNIYSIKYLKKNRRAGKQLEKVLKSKADRVILRPCLAERWVITHETPLQAFANLGQLPSVWSGEIILYKKQSLKAHQGNHTNKETEVKNMLADKLEAISTELEEIQGSLTGVRNIIAKRAISRVLNDLDDVYNELTRTEYHEQQQTLKEQTEKMKQRVIAEVIGELEEREESYYRNFWGDTKFIKLLSNFDGFLFLNTYLAEITKENTHPMKQSQLLNYVWEVIAVDIAKKKRGKKNVLDSWTDSSLYTRGMMID